MPRTQPQRVGRSDFPHYGAIFDVDLDPIIGSEIGKRRPAVVVSNDVNNQYANTVTVLPITSQQTRRHYPFEVLVPRGVAGLTANSRVKANQIRTIDKARLTRLRGQLPPEYVAQVQQAIRVHLDLK